MSSGAKFAAFEQMSCTVLLHRTGKQEVMVGGEPETVLDGDAFVPFDEVIIMSGYILVSISREALFLASLFDAP